MEDPDPSFEIKQEKADEYSETVCSPLPERPVSSHGSQGNVVFSFKTSDNDSITVVKTEPDDADANTDINVEADTEVKTEDEAETETTGVLSTINEIVEGSKTLVGAGAETTKEVLGHSETAVEAPGLDQVGRKVLVMRLLKDKCLKKSQNPVGERREASSEAACITDVSGGKGEVTLCGKKVILEEVPGLDAKGNKVMVMKLCKGGKRKIVSEILPSLKDEERINVPDQRGTTLPSEEVQRCDQERTNVQVVRVPKVKSEEVWANARAENLDSVGIRCFDTDKLHDQNRYRRAAQFMEHMMKSVEKTPKTQCVMITANTVETDVDSPSRKRAATSTELEVKRSKQESDISAVAQTAPKSKPSCNILKCLFCGRKFAQIVRFKHHMKTHIDKKPIVCTKCDEEFYFQSSLVEHHNKVHKKLIKYFCSVCKEHILEMDLSSHLMKHKLKEQFQCGICGDKLTSDTEMFEHVKHHENTIPARCGVCMQMLVDFDNLEVHLKEHFEEGQYVCEMCGKKLKTAVEFSEHAKLHLGTLPFSCEPCGIKFRNRMEFNYHKHRCPTSTKKSLQCEKCLKGFRNLADLQSHYENIHFAFPCNFCDSYYLKKEHLKAHLKTHEVVAHYI